MNISQVKDEGSNFMARFVVSLVHSWIVLSIGKLLANFSECDFFRNGFFIKVKEPTVLGVNICFLQPLWLWNPSWSHLYCTVIQTVSFILFQVKAFWFWWCFTDIQPIDFACLAHFALLRTLGPQEPLTNKWTAYMFVFAKACPYLPGLITIVQDSWQ